jgi:hypothetical protein
VRRLPRLEGTHLMSSQLHPDHPADAPAQGARPSRRSVLYGAAGLAGAGLAATAIAAPLAVPVAAAAATAPHSAGAAGSASEPVIVHVRDIRSGEMDIFSGETKTRLRNPALAAQLARAAH